MIYDDLVTPVNTRNIHYITGDSDHDQFIDKEDMTSSHWDLLMGCSHSGQCDNDCEEASRYFELHNYDKALQYLLECGIDEETFKDHDNEWTTDHNEDVILQYYLWMISSDIQELYETESKDA